MCPRDDDIIERPTLDAVEKVDPITDVERLIDLPAILRKIPVARSTIFAWMRDGVFPRGRKLGARRRLWRESEVDAFIRGL